MNPALFAAVAPAAGKAVQETGKTWRIIIIAGLALVALFAAMYFLMKPSISIINQAGVSEQPKKSNWIWPLSIFFDDTGELDALPTNPRDSIY
jgi:ABC-type phosphate transport system permease subunit